MPSSPSAWRCIVVGLLFKVAAVPFHQWTPDVYQGAPTAVTAFMAATVKIAAFGALLRVHVRRLRRHALGLGADDVDHRRPHDARRLDHRDHPDRHQADARVLVDRAGRLHPHRRHRRLGGGPRVVAVLPGGVRLHDDRRLRDRLDGARRVRRGHPPVEVGRPGQEVARRGGGLLPVPARRSPASRSRAASSPSSASSRPRSAAVRPGWSSSVSSPASSRRSSTSA